MNCPIQTRDVRHAKRFAPYRDAGLYTLAHRKKLSGTERRAAKRSTFQTLVLFPDKPVKSEIKLVIKLQSLPLVKVIRRQKQFARRAATAKYLLHKLAEKSLFRPGVETTHRNWIGFFNQARAEIEARSLAAKGRLAGD